jgi:DNA-directed RNA polymerase subunit RPC12/RpoP
MDLKTCPFCGAEVELVESEKKQYMVACQSCSARIIYANGYNSKHLTIRKFNKRTVDDASNARIIKRINNLIDECIEESSDTYANLALRELQIKIKYMKTENLGE